MPIFGKKKNDNENENPIENTAAENAENEVETQTVTSASTKKYETPEGFDFNRYFLAERRIVLENVNYEVHPVQPSGQPLPTPLHTQRQPLDSTCWPSSLVLKRRKHWPGQLSALIPKDLSLFPYPSLSCSYSIPAPAMKSTGRPST